MNSFYKPKNIESYYDEYSEKEWNGLHFSGHPRDEVNLIIHEHYLKKYVQKDDLVLDIGCILG
jgi:hypothetical protein